MKKKEKAQYSHTTRDNGKYIRLTEMLKIINGTLPESKRIARETLLARIKNYAENNKDFLVKNGIELIRQDPSPSPEKSPILVDYDYIQKNIPSLMESDTLRDLQEQIKNQAEQIRIIYEVMYLKGFLRRE
jgi:hypothetical protein